MRDPHHSSPRLLLESARKRKRDQEEYLMQSRNEEADYNVTEQMVDDGYSSGGAESEIDLERSEEQTERDDDDSLV